MAFLMNCDNRGCGKYTQPALDLKDNQVYCGDCGAVIKMATHFTKVQLKTLGQTRKPAKPAYSVRCDKCRNECLPKLDNNILVCGWCGEVSKNVSKPFEILIRAAIAKGDQDL
jgi:hypothetical protein